MPAEIPVDGKHIPHHGHKQNGTRHTNEPAVFAQRNHQPDVDGGGTQIDPGPEAMHVLGPEDLQPYKLNGGNNGAGKQQQGHG